ncbi:hypothetical protein GCM10009665_09530 [Kitasatospora nipponensis]|uniref:C1q domain-containing protein n=1 Tax=Kitasatospora nipponensis TaxID=258049 RepID=A0ABN1VU55_9ACTN
MSKLTPLSQLPYPESTDPADIPTHLQLLAQALDGRTVLRFDSTAARDAAIAQPVAGMLAYVKGSGFTCYTGTAWLPYPVQDPPFALYQQSANQSVPSTTSVAMVFPAPVIDTAGGYKPANPTRYTPTVPGYYQVTGQVAFSVDVNGGRCLNVMRNGAIIAQSAAAAITTTYYNTTVNATGYGFFNGTTDYVELYAHQNSPNTLTTIADGVKLTVVRIHS